MGGEDETLKLVLYIVVMLIVIYIGIGLVAGFDPRGWTRQISSVTYEPGKVFIKDKENLEKNTRLDCTQNSYTLILKDIKFGTKPGLEVQGDVLEFIVALDFKNYLFLGSDGDQNVKTVLCREKDGIFNCDDITLNFYFGSCTGTLSNNEVFHFTTWLSKPALLDAMRPTGACEFPPISKVLDDYGQFYLSSFNVNKNIATACAQSECESQDQTTCSTVAGCYWGGSPWSKSCQLCPSSNICNSYDGDACSQCPWPKLSCTPGALYGCNPS